MGSFAIEKAIFNSKFYKNLKVHYVTVFSFSKFTN